MTILSCKTIFGLTFSAILENLLESFFRKVPKTLTLDKMAIFWHARPNLGKMRIFLKNRAVLFFSLIVPQIHAKFRKNPWSRFRDQLRDIHTYGARTDKGQIIEPVTFAGSIKWHQTAITSLSLPPMALLNKLIFT